MAKEREIGYDLEIQIAAVVPWIRERRWRVNTNDYVEIDQDMINTSLSDQSKRTAWVGALAADARAERDAYKRALERLEAKLTIEYLRPRGEQEKKPTMKEVDAYVGQQKSFMEMQEKLARADWQVNQLDSLVRGALAHRIEGAVAIATNLRRELDAADPGRRVERTHEREEEYGRIRRERVADTDRSSERRPRR